MNPALNPADDPGVSPRTPARLSAAPSRSSGQTEPAPALRGGPDFAGSYDLLDKIGQGTHTLVYRARGRSGRIVAVKILRPESAADGRRVLRFHRAAELSQHIKHPNVVETIESGTVQGWHFVVMEYVDGGNLARFVMRSGELSERSALRIAGTVAMALDHIHRHGVLHRDVNPANILLSSDGRVLLGDLGLSKQFESDTRLTIDGTGLGTPDYIAPEQFTDTKELGPPADIYGLGTTLYVMLAGRLPFAGRTVTDKWMAKVQNAPRPLEEFNPLVSRPTRALIRRAMDADPDRRLPSARQFAEETQRCLAALTGTRSAPAAAPIEPREQEPVWHLLVPGPDGQLTCRSGTMNHVREMILGGRLGRDVPASCGGRDPFAPLGTLAPFLDLFPRHVQPAVPKATADVEIATPAPRGFRFSLARPLSRALRWLAGQLSS